MFWGNVIRNRMAILLTFGETGPWHKDAHLESQHLRRRAGDQCTKIIVSYVVSSRPAYGAGLQTTKDSLENHNRGHGC